MKKLSTVFNYVKTIKFPTEQGKDKKCQLCQKTLYVVGVREHQCRRCKRFVCSACSPNKAIILWEPKEGKQRICNLCKDESEQLKKFVEKNALSFLAETFAVEWLKNFGISKDEANQRYKESLSQKDKNNAEVQAMQDQIFPVLAELTSAQNFSLREFIALVSEKTNEKDMQTSIVRVLTNFLFKMPEVGYGPDLVIIILLLLCFGSEAQAYQLMIVLHTEILQPHLHPKAVKCNKYEYVKEREAIVAILTNAFKVNSTQALYVTGFLKNRLSRYISTLTVNMMQVETTHLILNEMFSNSQEGFNQLLFSLATILHFHLVEIKANSSNQDEVELIILRQTKSQQVLENLPKARTGLNQAPPEPFQRLNVQRQMSAVVDGSNGFFQQELLKQQSDEIGQLQTEIKSYQEEVAALQQENQALQVKLSELQDELSQSPLKRSESVRQGSARKSIVIRKREAQEIDQTENRMAELVTKLDSEFQELRDFALAFSNTFEDDDLLSYRQYVDKLEQCLIQFNVKSEELEANNQRLQDEYVKLDEVKQALELGKPREYTEQALYHYRQVLKDPSYVDTEEQRRQSENNQVTAQLQQTEQELSTLKQLYAINIYKREELEKRVEAQEAQLKLKDQEIINKKLHFELANLEKEEGRQQLIESLQKEVQELQSQLEDQAKGYESLIGQLTTLKQQNEEQTQLIHSLSQDKLIIQNQGREFDEKLQHLQGEKEQMNAEVTRLQLQLLDLGNTKQEVDAVRIELEAQLKLVQSQLLETENSSKSKDEQTAIQIQNLNLQLHQTQQEHSGAISSLNENLKLLESQKLNLEGQLQAIKEELSGNQGQMIGEIQKISEQKAALEFTLAENATVILQLRERLAKTEKDLSLQQIELQEATKTAVEEKKEKESLLSQLGSLSIELSAKSEKLKSLELVLVEETAKLTALSLALEEKGEQSTSLSQQYHQLRLQFELLDKALGEQRVINLEVNQALEDAQKQLQQLREELNAERKGHEELTSKNEAARRAYLIEQEMLLNKIQSLQEENERKTAQQNSQIEQIQKEKQNLSEILNAYKAQEVHKFEQINQLISDKEQKVLDAVKEANDLAQKNKELNLQIQDLMRVLEEKINEGKKFNEGSQAAQQAAAQLQAQLKQSESTILEYRQAYKEQEEILKQQIISLSIALSDQQAAFDAQSKETQAKVKELEEKNIGLHSSIKLNLDQLAAGEETKKSEIANLKEQIAQLKSHIQEREAQLETQQAAFQQLSQEHQLVKQSIDLYKSEQAQKEMQIAKLSEENTTRANNESQFESLIQSLQQQLESHKFEISSEQGKIQELESRLALANSSLHKEAEQHKLELAQAEEKLSTKMKLDLIAQRTLLEESNQTDQQLLLEEIRKLKEQLAEAHVQVQGLIEKNQSMDHLKSLLEAQIVKLQASHQQLSEELNQAKQSIDLLKSELAQKELQLVKLIGEIDTRKDGESQLDILIQTLRQQIESQNASIRNQQEKVQDLESKLALADASNLKEAEQHKLELAQVEERLSAKQKLELIAQRTLLEESRQADQLLKQEEISKVKAQLAETLVQVSTLLNEKGILEERYEQTAKEYATYKEQSQQAQSALENLQTLHAELTAVLQQEREASQQQEQHLKQQLSQFDSEKLEMTKKLQDLEEKLTQSKTSFNGLSQRILELQQDLEQQEQSKKAHIQELDEKRFSLQDLEKQLAELESRLVCQQLAAEDFQQQLGTVAREKEMLISSFERERREIIDQAETLKTCLADSQKDSGKHLSELQREIEALRQEKTSMETAISEMKDLEKQRSEAHAAALADIENLLNHSREQVNEMTGKAHQLNTQLQDAEKVSEVDKASLKKLGEEVNLLKLEIGELENKLRHTEQTAVEQQSAYKGQEEILRQQIVSLSLAISEQAAQHEIALKEAQLRIKELEERNQNIQNQIKATTDQLDSSQSQMIAEIQRLTDQITSLEFKLTDKEKNQELIEHEKLVLKQQLEQKGLELLTLQEQHAIVKDEINAIASQLQSTLRQVEEHKAESELASKTVQELSQKIENLNGEIHSIEENSAMLKQNFDLQTQSNDAINASKLENLTLKCSELALTNEELAAELSRWKQDFEALNLLASQERDNLTGQVKGLKNDLLIASEQQGELNLRLENQTKDVAALGETKQQLFEACQSLEEKLKQREIEAGTQLDEKQKQQQEAEAKSEQLASQVRQLEEQISISEQMYAAESGRLKQELVTSSLLIEENNSKVQELLAEKGQLQIQCDELIVQLEHANKQPSKLAGQEDRDCEIDRLNLELQQAQQKIEDLQQTLKEHSRLEEEERAKLFNHNLQVQLDHEQDHSHGHDHENPRELAGDENHETRSKDVEALSKEIQELHFKLRDREEAIVQQQMCIDSLASQVEQLTKIGQEEQGTVSASTNEGHQATTENFRPKVSTEHQLQDNSRFTQWEGSSIDREEELLNELLESVIRIVNPDYSGPVKVQSVLEFIKEYQRLDQELQHLEGQVSRAETDSLVERTKLFKQQTQIEINQLLEQLRYQTEIMKEISMILEQLPRLTTQQIYSFQENRMETQEDESEDVKDLLAARTYQNVWLKMALLEKQEKLGQIYKIACQVRETAAKNAK